MSKRIVVCMRWRPAEEGASEQGFAQVAESILDRTLALGGRLILWHPEWLGVDFGLDELQDAIDFLVDRPPVSFSTGFVYGESRDLVDGGPLLAACSGPAVDLAVALARMARAGEVLVDPQLVKASGGELLVQGARVATVAGERIRGLKLDLQHPQRSLECENLTLLEAPRFELSAEAAAPPSGKGISVLVAPTGGGGSSFLLAHRARHAPAALLVSPYRSGEPLAALRHALVRDAAERGGPPSLDSSESETFEAIKTSAGADKRALAKLLTSWARARGGPGLRYVEDVEQVDWDSLDVLTGVAKDEDSGLVVLLRESSALPSPLAVLDKRQTLKVPGLAEPQAVELLRQMTRGALPTELSERVAKRGLPSPLAVTQSMIEALDGVSLLWKEDGIVPRVKRDEQVEAQTAQSLIQRRLHFVDPTDLLVLDALAVLGGPAPRPEVHELLKVAGRPVHRFEASVEYLIRMSWLAAGPGNTIRLLNRTCRDAIVASLSERRAAALHQACAVLHSRAGRPLSLGSAALHAALAGNEGKALLLAKSAAGAARELGLEESAQVFERYAETRDFTCLTRRSLAGRWTNVDEGGAPEAHDDHLFPADATEDSELDEITRVMEPGQRPDAPGGEAAEQAPETPQPERPAAGGRLEEILPMSTGEEMPVPHAPASEPLDLASFRPPIRETLRRRAANRSGALPSSRRDGRGDELTRPGETLRSEPGDAEERTSIEMEGLASDGDSLLPARAFAALKHGDAATLEELALQVRADSHETLANRLDALGQLVKGNVGEALRRLRDAKATSKNQGSREQCRAALALGIGLAAAGRENDALLEVLDGLARARSARDTRGERACARFLVNVAKRSGRDELAEAWQALGG